MKGALPVSALILVTNDDGVGSRGLWALARGLRAVGEVVVVAPDGEYSGSGASIAGKGPVPCRSAVGPVRAYAMGAPPAACVWAGVQTLLPRRPDLVVSGINHGPNLGRDWLISGTVGAALFAGSRGIPALAVSTDMSGEPDWRAPVQAAVAAAEAMLAEALPEPVVLNLNVPAGERVLGAQTAALSGCSFLEQVELELRHDGEKMLLTHTLRPRAPHKAPPGTDLAVYSQGLAAVTLLEPRPAPLWAVERANRICEAIRKSSPAGAAVSRPASVEAQDV